MQAGQPGILDIPLNNLPLFRCALPRMTVECCYYFFAMSLVMGALIAAGFSKTVDRSLFHATPPRPLLLWLHGAAFSAWVILFAAQSGLVSVRKVSVHMLLVWF